MICTSGNTVVIYVTNITRMNQNIFTGTTFTRYKFENVLFAMIIMFLELVISLDKKSSKLLLLYEKL